MPDGNKSESIESEVNLQERVKELTCLYEVVRLAQRSDTAPLATVFQGVANLLPSAWYHSQVAAGRVLFDGQPYATDGFQETAFMLSSDIVVHQQTRGRIEVVYLEACPQAFEGPFLKEERNLLDAIAKEVSGIVERHQARDERAMLENQLRHADRLATIGQLAAGVAHELNEPLANILGFAQLAQKTKNLPDGVAGDLTKIVEACLHSRNIVNKLRLFARQMPANRKEVDLNGIISEGLYFTESRCAKQGIEIVRKLDSALPSIVADPGQIHQVLVNLTVNSVQAMPDGGLLTISTYVKDDKVALRVEDTGLGMAGNVLEKIFVPFFTTKDVDQGTGLGLSVVEGIVTTHGGTINVDSSPGKGTLFEVSLPIDGTMGKE
jgi:signal transduction histidine kinase